MTLSDLPITFLGHQGSFGTCLRYFRAQDPFQSSSPSYPRSSALSASKRSPSIVPRFFLRHLKNFFRSPHRLFIPPNIFRFPKVGSELLKVLCSSQAPSNLRKSCFRSWDILPGAGPESPWHFTRCRSRQKQCR